jgi:hypothetical protein
LRRSARRCKPIGCNMAFKGNDRIDAMKRDVLVLTAAAALALAGSALAATYKWVDDKGVVHYSDKIPPEIVDKGSTELSKQGVLVKRTDPAPTAEQRRAKAAEEERQKVIAREREVVDRRDRALLQSYTSEDEIDLARNRALSTIDSQLQSAQAYSVQLTKRRQELDKNRKAFGDKPVPPAIDRELESIGSELAKQDTFIAEKKHENAVVTARYDADKQRWRELRAITEAREAREARDAKDTKDGARDIKDKDGTAAIVGRSTGSTTGSGTAVGTPPR